MIKAITEWKKKEILKRKIQCDVISASIKEDVKNVVSNLDVKPKLAIVQVGYDYGSSKYIKNKIKACESCGIEAEAFSLEEDKTTEDVIALVEYLNEANCIDGIIVQLPLPKTIDTDKVLGRINPLKDIDCLTPTNVGLLHLAKPYVAPCTPAGIVEMLKRQNNTINGKSVLMIGRSHIVGRPLAEMLTQLDATVTLAHSNSTYNVNKYDIVISAIGKPNAIKVRNKNAVLIDVGINRSDKGKLTGDFDIENSKFKAYTSVPGGVGLLTTAMVCKNTLDLYMNRRGK